MTSPNQAQIELWDGRVGEKWAALQANLDAMLVEVTAELKRRAGSVAGRRVLDIGCGAGETCLAWLAGGAEVTGIDVSGAMLAVAAKRIGGRAALIKADAATWRSERPFDLAVSQFGLMFFDDPERAFAAIAADLRPGGRLLFVCWRAAADNQWVSVPMRAIRDLLPPAAAPADPHAPGPFALADRDRLRGLLARAGFADIAIEPFDCALHFASEGGVDAAVRLAMQVGPSGSALVGASPETLARAAERLQEALTPHAREDRVSLGGAVWMVEAVRPAPA
jgi:SAM-dependent methyltransferase